MRWRKGLLTDVAEDLLAFVCDVWGVVLGSLAIEIGVMLQIYPVKSILRHLPPQVLSITSHANNKVNSFETTMQRLLSSVVLLISPRMQDKGPG